MSLKYDGGLVLLAERTVGNSGNNYRWVQRCESNYDNDRKKMADQLQQLGIDPDYLRYATRLPTVRFANGKVVKFGGILLRRGSRERSELKLKLSLNRWKIILS
jgi:hypothetical protein